MGSDECSADDPPPPYAEMDPNPGAMGTFAEEQGAARPFEPPATLIGEGVPVALAIPVAVGVAPPSVSTAGHVHGAPSSGCVGRNLWLVGGVAALVLASVIALVVGLTVGSSGGGVDRTDTLSGGGASGAEPTPPPGGLAPPPSESTDGDECQQNAGGWEWPVLLNFEGDPDSAAPASDLGRLMKSSPENPIRVPLGRCAHIFMANFQGGIFQYQGLTPRKSWEECVESEAATIRSSYNGNVAVFAPDAPGLYFFSDFEANCAKGKKFVIEAYDADG
jgi:hypothetical protein